MSNSHETIADIIAEMRRGTRLPGFWRSYDLNKILQYHADRLEAAHKRELESITPKPDPDWKGICARCKDGDIEPKHCEYYGEPNGCNSPIYGEHPTAENSSAVGDVAKLREALEELVANIEMRASVFGIFSIIDRKTFLDAKAALAAPPRNCDRPECATTAAAADVWRKEDGGKTAYYAWLLAPATKKEGGAK